MNLQLTVRINSGEFERGALRLPLRVTDVKLTNGGFSSLILRTLFGEWLDPRTWDKKLPEIEIPMEIAETMRIPAGRFDVAGELPMEISTPEYQAPLKFTVTSLLALDKRAVVSLRLGQDAPAKPIPVSYVGDGADANNIDPMALEDEIARMSERLKFVGEGKKIFLRAAPGSTLPIDAQFNLKIAGHDVRFDRRSVAQADKWLNRIELPSFFDREISLPSKIKIDAGGRPRIIESRNLGYTLSNMRVGAKDDAIDITADVGFDRQLDH